MYLYRWSYYVSGLCVLYIDILVSVYPFNILISILISVSLFLSDRKVLRYFRKDGHNWRKKKDGKTVKEAHEKLKVNNIFTFMFPHYCFYKYFRVTLFNYIYRLEALMCYIVTMHMRKTMKISRGVATGRLNSESYVFHISHFYRFSVP